MPPWCRSTEVGQSRQASDSGHRLFVFSGPWSPAFATGRDGHRGKTLAVATCATVRCRRAIVSRSPVRIRRRSAGQNTKPGCGSSDGIAGPEADCCYASSTR
jgi:hypothetical protein